MTRPKLSAAAAILAAIWLALVLPRVDCRYSYHWDSSQFERGAVHFDVAHHQPHPPGYPLWVFTIRLLAHLTGGINRAQVLLAVLFTGAAVLVFWSLAREMLGVPAGLAATSALAFSPLVLLYAITPLLLAVDLFNSCLAAWFAARLWKGEARWAPAACAALAAGAGFRQSGAVFLAPFLAAALVRAWRANWRYVAAGILAGAVCGLAWYVPTAVLCGGFTVLPALTRAQFVVSARLQSVFFGAPVGTHLRMIEAASATILMALAGLGLPVLARLVLGKRGETGAEKRPAWVRPGFFAWWIVPSLLPTYLFHFGQPGYVLVAIPPLALVGAWVARSWLREWRWVAATAGVALLVSYFPYERWINPAGPTAVFQALRSSPRLPGLLESSQRELRKLIDALPGKTIVCLLGRPEAPNVRTVTFEFADVTWVDPESKGPWPDAAVLGWLCDGAGLPEDIRAHFPDAKRAGGNRLYSLWTTGGGTAEAREWAQRRGRRSEDGR